MESQADAGTLVDTARRIQPAAMLTQDLIEQARRELDLAEYKDPAARADVLIRSRTRRRPTAWGMRWTR